MRLIFILLAWSSLSLADAEVEAPQQFATFEKCPLISGQVIAPCRIAYRTYGILNEDKSNAVLVPTWYTGTSAESADLLIPGAISPEKYFVVVVDALGNGVSTSPSNSETQANDAFPQVTITDMVQSQHRLLTEVFGIHSLHAVVGLSMGGMQAFEWAVRFPGFAGKTVPVIGSPRLPAFDIALWTTRNLLLDLYRDCQCTEPLQVMQGIGMITSVPGKLAQEVAREEVVSTMISRTEPGSMNVGKSWDQTRQAEAMMSHNIARDFDDDMQLAAAQTRTEFLIIIGEDDRVVTPGPALGFATLLYIDVLELDEDCGHGDPWCAPDAFASALSNFLDED